MIKWIREFLEWYRKDRQEIFVASAIFTMRWEDTGYKTQIICSYYIDGNGLRYTKVDAEDSPCGRSAKKTHMYMNESRHNWIMFGDLPDHARRVEEKTKGKLYSITGGKDI